MTLKLTLDERIGRRTYFGNGVLFMALKYAGDVALVRGVVGKWWTPADYLSPLFTTHAQVLTPAPEWFWVLFVAWTLPFLWIGISMTLWRAIDAGWSPWTALLFFVPLANWGVMLLLSVVPTKPRAQLPEVDQRARSQMTAALQGVAGGVAVSAVSFSLHVLLLKTYNSAVFLGTPFTMGAVAGYVYNRDGTKPGTIAIGALTVTIGMLATLLFAMEGILCIAMALPIAMLLGCSGAIIGKAIALERRATLPGAGVVLLALVASAADARLTRPPLREVLSSVEIDAPPEKVWPHVIGFSGIESPPAVVFRLGIAYPVRARLEGKGVGAVRRCEFSTGAFVEPITAWEEPTRLAFDVREQPPALHEWSPYKVVHAQHLVDTLRSRRGEFRLVPLPGGRTRLEGRTFYELAMEPQPYWAFFSDALIHRIHQRVLHHIAAEAVSAHP